MNSNDDLNVVIPAKQGSGDGTPSGSDVCCGHKTLDKADGGRSRRGRSPSTMRSMEGMDVYRPHGR